MGDNNLLGPFEEAVLASVMRLGKSAAYSMSIWEDVVERTNEKRSMGSAHATLQRLEDKGYVSSELRGARPERGERRRRYYTVTGLGEKALNRNVSFRSAALEGLDDLLGNLA